MSLFWIIGLILYGGTITVSTTTSIVNSNPTTIEKYPFIVQVESLRHFRDVWIYTCGATIITARFVLSAAQCFSGWNSVALYHRIRAGSAYRQNGGTIVYVEKALNHPSYGSNGIDGDISVVKLVRPLSHSSTIQQATIVAHGSNVPDNLAVVLAGWGQDFAGGPHWNILRDMTLRTINNRLCAQRYMEIEAPFEVTQTMICTGTLDGGERDSCTDGYGGPVYFRGVVIGVVSGTYDCGNGTLFGIKTAVASYTNWIVASTVNM